MIDWKKLDPQETLFFVFTFVFLFLVLYLDL